MKKFCQPYYQIILMEQSKKIRKAAQAKEKSEDIAKWAVTNTDDDRNKDV